MCGAGRLRAAGRGSQNIKIGLCFVWQQSLARFRLRNLVSGSGSGGSQNIKIGLCFVWQQSLARFRLRNLVSGSGSGGSQNIKIGLCFVWQQSLARFRLSTTHYSSLVVMAAEDDPVARAKAIAAKLAAGISGGGGGGGEDGVLGKRNVGGGDDARKRIKITVPEDMEREMNLSGILIGPKGSNLQALQERTGARVLLRGKGSTKDPNPGDPDANEPLHVVIEGTEEAVAAASAEVNRLITDPKEAMRLKNEQLNRLAELKGGGGGGGGSGGGGGGDGHYGPPAVDVHEVSFEVPNSVVGSIIGRGGETIQKIQAQYGISVQVAKATDVAPGAPTRPVTLKGPQEAVEMAKGDIELLVADRLSGQQGMGGGGGGGSLMGGGLGGGGASGVGAYGPGASSDGAGGVAGAGAAFSVAKVIPNDKVGLVIGKGGGTIKGMQMRTGANIQIPTTPDMDNPSQRTITISASSQEACDLASQEVQNVLDAGPTGTGTVSGGTTLYIQVPNDRVGLIIGKGGATIKDVQNRTGARIQIPQQPDPGSIPPVRTVSISGIGNAPAQAKYEIEYMCANDSFGQAAPGGGYGHDQYGGGHYQQQPQQAYGAHAAGGYAYGAYSAADPYQQYAQPQQQQAYYDQRYQQPGLSDPYAPQASSGTGNGDSASVPQAGGASGSTAAPASTEGGAVDMTQYYPQFWQYAAYYGESVARKQYGAWAPPEGTPPPPGVVIPAQGQPLPPAGQQ
jgi:far upstream element-binding protein